ncbi:spermatogenesis-associated protein 31E1-like [Panthera uncia]|uniref:spermatogenesis-associated protein 31E1-like n=1 Tax=Panthera uncia TaxID=29064 RepID=UPI0020FFCE9D|nr:spermatogenesis-associated protein 31E1-like [Panthera uncia]
MENILFALRSISAGWLSSSLPSWTTQTIFCFLCGLSFFLLLIFGFQTDPTSSAPRRKRRSSRKQVAPRRRSTRGKKSELLKAYRNCLQELEGVRDLVSLLQSHLGRLSDQGGLHQLLGQEAPGAAGKAAPAGAHQPRGEPVRDAAPATAPQASPTLNQHPPRLASILPVGPQEDQSNLKRTPADTVTENSPPGNSHLAPLVPAVSGLGHASYPILSLSWWWESTKSWFFPIWAPRQCHQQHLTCHPKEALSWGGPSRRQIETRNPSFVNPDVQKLLEVLITKRAEQKIWKEKERDGSHVKQLDSDNPLNFGGTLWKFLGAEQDTTNPRSFWHRKNKLEKLPSPRQLSFPKVLGDNSQQKCSQLFWGLPSLHSESLKAPALASSSQLHVPSVLFNVISNCLPILIQQQISSRFPPAPPLPCRGIQPQPSTPTVSQPQAHLAPSVPIRPPSPPPQMRTYGVSGPPSQKKTPPFIPTEIQPREQPLLQKQPEGERTLPLVLKIPPKVLSSIPPKLLQDSQASEAHESVSIFHRDFVICDIQKQNLQRRLSKDKHQGSLAHRVQVSLDRMWPQGEFPGLSQAQDKQGLSRSFASKSKSSQATQRTRSRHPRSSRRKGRARFQLEDNFGMGLQRCLRRIPTDLSRVLANFPVKVPGTSSEKDLERYLMRTLKRDSGKYLARSPDKKHVEKTLKVHLRKKLGQISKGLIPVSVRRSWLVANHILPKCHTHTEIRNLAPLKSRKPCVNTSHELSFLNSLTQQMLEAHIVRFRVKHKWGPPLRAFESINLKPYEAQPLPFPRSPSPCLATCVSGAHSKAKFYKFLGKPSQPYPGEKGIAEESVPTSGSSLPAPSPPSEEIQKSLEGTSPGDSHEPSEAALPGQEGSSPSPTFTLSLINRTPQSETVMGAKKGNLEPSLSSEIARNELRAKRGAQASQEKVAILEMKSWSQSSGAEEARETMEAEKAPAWKVILGPRVLANSQTSYVDRRRLGSPGTSKSPSPPTELVAQEPKEPILKTKVTIKFGLQEKEESEGQPQGCATGVLLQGCPRNIALQDFATGILVQDLDTGVLLQDSHTDVFLAEDILKSPSGSQGQYSSRETPASLVPETDLISSRPSSQGQQEPSIPKADEPRKSQSKMTASTGERKDQKSPKLEGNEKAFVELRASQASRLSHPHQVRGTGDSLGSKCLQPVPEKGQIFPESHFRKKMRYFLHCLHLNKKGKGLEDPLQKGNPASATVQGLGPVRSRSVVGGKAVETQTIVTTVGQILVEKLGLHQGLHASEVNQHKEFQGPVGSPTQTRGGR